MDPLVIIAPLHLALSIVQWYCDDRGWFDYTGLWRPYVQKPCECGYRSVLRAAAEPFVPGPSQKEHYPQHTHSTQGDFLEDADCPREMVLEQACAPDVGEKPDASVCNTAGADSRMLNGGEGSYTGRRSRQADSSTYRPGHDPSSRREVEELHEKHQNDANAVSHMLNGGDESSSGRRSREPDSPMYNPGYDPSINTTRRDHLEVPPEQKSDAAAVHNNSQSAKAVSRMLSGGEESCRGDDEFYSDEDDWDQDPPAPKPETADSFLDNADWRQLKAASRQHLALADEIDMSKLQELTSDSEFFGQEEEGYGEEDDYDQCLPASVPNLAGSLPQNAHSRHVDDESGDDQLDNESSHPDQDRGASCFETNPRSPGGDGRERGRLYGPAKQPKIAPSAYLIFVQERRPTLTGTVIQVAEQLRTGWSLLCTHEKRGFEKKSKEMQEQCDREARE